MDSMANATFEEGVREKHKNGVNKSIEKSRGRTRERLFSSHHWSGPPTNAIYMEEAIATPTIIRNTLTPEQIEAYVILVRIEEICNIISSGNYVPKDERLRSPSPPPVYDASGRRKNTREVRYKRKYENERCFLVERALKLIPGFKTPDWYNPRPTTIVEKLYIKTKEYPQINFIGLLIGPRGNTLNKLQEDSGARIGIRGKGSVKEGKNTMNISPELNNLQDQLHCLITADSVEKVEKAKKLCQQVMDKAIFSPAGQNDLKRDQLRELAKLNGTFRDDTERACPVCGEMGHNRNTCPNKNRTNFVNSLVCSKCGNVGHLEKDCKIQSKADDHMDQEFADFMNELNEDAEGTGNDGGISSKDGDFKDRVPLHQPHMIPTKPSLQNNDNFTSNNNKRFSEHSHYDSYDGYGGGADGAGGANGYKRQHHGDAYSSQGISGYRQGYGHQYTQSYGGDRYGQDQQYQYRQSYGSRYGYGQQQDHQHHSHGKQYDTQPPSYSSSINPFDKQSRATHPRQQLPPPPPTSSSATIVSTTNYAPASTTGGALSVGLQAPPGLKNRSSVFSPPPPPPPPGGGSNSKTGTSLRKQVPPPPPPPPAA
ncbi:hypothetical protein PICMEDRAFT_16932 [Pichia membranifaciens NRRL Y-2026]|uniref:Branchpoint-bridging protein n=1 Tax=Pichia membranifaciens NRRL Y-2026 TaxID=763406 RepID=A0A1E3NHN1_9ASCO|nr:hypothetical protein PICMEDRAFT_16932 [Pichia membranifaciens NRRL Y-2026]ODQ45637.1 hypothetical protein PICMEDRAFT_16932 [Pichia membranifaciens NRRL Y-2026]